jgi:hypothetical protein
VNRLTITTQFADTVVRLLLQQQLVERHQIVTLQSVPSGFVEVNYPDDALSQSLVFWFALATACGLMTDYDFQFVPHCA